MMMMKRKQFFLGIIVVITCFSLPGRFAFVSSSTASNVINTAKACVKSDTVEPPSTLETALLQYGRLFSQNRDTSEYSTRVQEGKNIMPIRAMSRNERIIRIVLSWSLLIFAKSVALASPLYFKSLIERAEFLGKSDFVMPTISAFDKKNRILYCLKYGVDSLIHASALGLMIGYGATRLAAGFIQLTSEVLLSPVTTTVAEILPQQVRSGSLYIRLCIPILHLSDCSLLKAFAAALRSASRRTDDTGGNMKQVSKIESTSGEDTSTSGFARYYCPLIIIFLSEMKEDYNLYCRWFF